jgi:hypothetical protein
MRQIEIVVDGTDSGGKTPCVEALHRAFGRQRDVRACAPFRVREVYDLWAREPRQAAMIIRSVMDQFRQRHAAAEVIIWDRGWPTVWVSTTDAMARDALLPFPTLTILLLNSIETTMRKVEKHRLRATWLNDPALVRHYHDAYHALPRMIDGVKLAAFLPSAEGRYDYAEICEYVVGRT